jgi:hypothetical protein
VLGLFRDRQKGLAALVCVVAGLAVGFYAFRLLG